MRFTSIDSRCPSSQLATTVTVVTRLLCGKTTVGSIFKVKEGTAAGEVTSAVVEPKPNWPKVLSPQQDTPPVVSRAQLWRRPVVMFTALVRGWYRVTPRPWTTRVTGAGNQWGNVVESPN